MKAVLLGSRGHITKPLTRLLVSNGIDTTVITRSSVNAAVIEAEGAKAAVGSIDDTAFLTRTLQGANAVFLLIVADLFRKGTVKHMNQQCHNLCDVVLQANIPNVVYLSSVGADNPKVGFHYGNECILKERLSELPNVSLVRPTAFLLTFFVILEPSRKTNAFITTYQKVKLSLMFTQPILLRYVPISSLILL